MNFKIKFVCIVSELKSDEFQIEICLHCFRVEKKRKRMNRNFLVTGGAQGIGLAYCRFTTNSLSSSSKSMLAPDSS